MKCINCDNETQEKYWNHKLHRFEPICDDCLELAQKNLRKCWERCKPKVSPQKEGKKANDQHKQDGDVKHGN